MSFRLPPELRRDLDKYMREKGILSYANATRAALYAFFGAA